MLLGIFNIFTIIVFCFYLSIFILDYPSISNIGGPSFGMVVLCALSYLFNKKNPAKPCFLKIINSIEKAPEKTFVSIAVFILFIIFCALSFARHFALSSGMFDLGVFDQAVWNSAQGDILFSSLKGNINLLGEHFEPILLIFAPLYKVWPDVRVLLIIQSLLLSSAIFPLYLIAKEKLSSCRLLIFAFIISYILSRPLRGVALSDFHPECIILPALFWAYYFLLKKRNALFFITIFVLLLCKEDVGFLIAGFGIFAAFFEKRLRLGLALVFLGLSAWFVETKYIIPYFNPSGAYPYMNRLPFGAAYADNFTAVLHNPALLARLFFTGDKIEYVIKIFGPLIFLSFLSPSHYILIAIPLLKNLIISDNNFSGFYNISSHYTAGVIPFIFIAAIYGARRLVDKANRKNSGRVIAALIIISALFFYGKTDAHKFWKFMRTIKKEQTLEKIAYLKQVPVAASVAANFNLVPHLSQRKYIFQWNPLEQHSRSAQYLVIDLSLLEYLGKEEISNIPAYFKEIELLGYKKILENPQKNFFIYHNLNAPADLSID